MTDPRTPQPQVDLPQGTLLRANYASAAVAAAIGFLGALAIGQGVATAGETALGAAITGGVAVAGTMLLRPHHQRPILTWASLLIVLATGRLMVSGGLCLLLYFAAQLPAAPLLIGMLLTLAIVLFTETRIAANRFKQVTSTATTSEPDA